MDFSQLFKRKAQAGNVAKDRLKLLLIHDRINCSSALMDMMKADIVAVISKYMEIDADELNIQLLTIPSDEYSEKVSMLSANIPVQRLKI
ncbi:MAG: cell division topological specificity factor MinE [Candidatus Epulonipiscioides saccharophilum]|nr:cell division topological specificity factor MinE [Epulopiscium sp. SCG-B10WGA-EpuloB]OON94699.1 MAG: cell division topological specificity factor MinE [Epulopiscium sp. AS2M-Bin001]